MVPTLADKQSVPIVVSGDFTAVNNAAYIAIATLTVTDPTPSVGANYIVHIRNGTATIGGVGYAAGQDVHRVWHSGSWTSTPMPSRAATVTNGRLTEFDASGNLQNSNVQDGVTGGVATLAATLTFDRTYTLPNAAITVAGINLSQTWTANQHVLSGAGYFAGALSATYLFGNASTIGGAVGYQTTGLSANSFLALDLRRWTGTATNHHTTGMGMESSGGNWIGALYYNAQATNTNATTAILTWNASGLTALQPITVPNGTAAAPGLRLTSEASGLYRIGSTSVGISVAGSLVLTVGSTASSFASGTTLAVSNTTASTSTTTGALTVAGGIGCNEKITCVSLQTTGNGILTASRTSTTGSAAVLSGTGTLSGAVTDGFLSSLNIAPTYDQAFTVTRHNYINFTNPARTNSAVVTDACVMRFDAAAGTHLAVASGTTKTTPGTVDAWVKININGTLHYIPAYTSTTT